MSASRVVFDIEEALAKIEALVGFLASTKERAVSADAEHEGCLDDLAAATETAEKLAARVEELELLLGDHERYAADWATLLRLARLSVSHPSAMLEVAMLSTPTWTELQTTEVLK